MNVQTPLLTLALLACCLATPAQARDGCSKDRDCKGDRICNEEGRCVDPEPCPPCDCDCADDPPELGVQPDPVLSYKPPVTERPVAAAGDLVVTLTDDSPVLAIEVTCPSGFRERATVENRTVTMADLPDGECALFFRGAVVASFRPVQAGQSLLCYIQGSTAVCQ